MTGKIIQLDKLPFVLSFPERRRTRVVQAHGCFDMLHVSHCEHLEQARLYGDILVVTVTSDKYVNKGAGRPVFSEQQRAKMLSYISFVDFVAISDYPNAAIPIGIIQPSVYAKGCDYIDSGVIVEEREALAKVNGQLVLTTTEKYSTTEIIAKLKV